jgi:peptidyl-prolyl cis-trans isomerase C
VTRCYHLTGVVLAITLSLAACGGGDKSESGLDGKRAVAFPDSIVDEELLVRVNNHPIRGKDLRTYAVLYGLGTEDSLNSRSFNESVLDGLIDRTLLWLESEALGVTIDDSTQDWFVRQFIAATGGDRAMDRTLTSANLTRSDLKQMIAQDLQVRKFIEDSVSRPPAIPDSLAESYYQANPEQFWTADSVRVRHVIIRASKNDTDTDIENKKRTLRDIRQRVVDGANFAELAKIHSQGPSAPAGGDLGYFTRQDMVKPFSDAAFSLEPGEVSDVVTTSFGYHIIEMVDKKPRRKLEYREVEAELKNQLAQNMVGQDLQNHLHMSRSVAIIERNY